jgi:uncharacterized protein (TIGR02118 family)
VREHQQARCLILLTRKENLTREEFNRHWLDVHAEIAKEYPHVLFYAQLHLVDEGSTDEHDYGIDGIAEFVFDSRANFPKIWETEVGKRGLEDASTFLAASRSYFVDSHVIVDHLDPTTSSRE